MIWGSGRSKSRLAKAAGAEPAGQMRDEKVHAVVARSTFASEKAKNTLRSDHFWKLRCRKSGRPCGAKHISKWKGSWAKCAKHTMYGSFLEVQMSKKCTPFVARSTFPSQNVENTPCTDHCLEVQMLFRVAGARDCFKSDQNVKVFYHFQLQPPLHYTTLQYITLHSTTIHSTTPTTLHYTTLNYTQLHSITLHYITLHSTTLHYITLHYTTFHYTTLHYTIHYTPLHYITLHYTTFHYTPLHYTTLHSTTLHYTTLHYRQLHITTLHSTTTTTTQLHSRTLHYTPLH